MDYLLLAARDALRDFTT